LKSPCSPCRKDREGLGFFFPPIYRLRRFENGSHTSFKVLQFFRAFLELTAATEPGPFLPQTIQMGSYFGNRRNISECRAPERSMADGARFHDMGWNSWF
jgi:hypothetical protein